MRPPRRVLPLPEHPSAVHVEREEQAAVKALMRLAERCPDPRVSPEEVDRTLGTHRTTTPCSIKVAGDDSGYAWSCTCGCADDRRLATLDEAESAALLHLGIA